MIRVTIDIRTIDNGYLFNVRGGVRPICCLFCKDLKAVALAIDEVDLEEFFGKKELVKDESE